MPVAQYLIFAALLPLAGFLLLIFFGKRFGRLAGAFSSLLILGSFALSVAALVGWVNKPEFSNDHYVEALTYRWITFPATVAPAGAVPAGETLAAAIPAAQSPALTVGFLVDSLTIAMFLMVTIIALLVHLFSIAYMAADVRFPRYFAYLGLFCFAMLGLVLSNSLVQLFVFWELVGICSYLLIGFWFERRGPAMASLKAVIVNRVGDAAFLVGLGLLMMHVGAAGLTLFDAEGTSLLAAGVRNAMSVGSSEFLYSTSVGAAGAGGFLGLHWLTWAGLCLFGGAVAKSAQFPLHVWLPDAMEGPSPISALIHAATMVAAGVYLVARIYPILTMDARLVIAVIGCVTLLMGALIALVQTDIKRVLAYSTISQIGYMMLFLGAGGYVAGLLHLFTHAFFKACLFLGAGSVIHSLHHEQRLEQMGGLWKKLPITAATFLVGTLALIGVPLFSGAYSKELGLAAVYQYATALAGGGAHYAMLLFWVPALTMYVTAFYMGRCWWLAFAGKSRNEELVEDAHESALMTLPLIILAILSISIWFEFFRMHLLLAKSLPLQQEVRVIGANEGMLAPMVGYVGRYFLWSPLVAALLAIPMYWGGFAKAARVRKWPVVNLLYIWLREKMFFDALYNGVVAGVVLLGSQVAWFVDRYVVDGVVAFATLLTRGLSRLSGIVDANLVDGIVNGVAEAASWTGKGALSPQGGRIRIYVLVMCTGLALAGMVVFLTAFLRHG